LAGLRRESLNYVGLLSSHIQKEDNVLFPMGRNVLSRGELEQLRAKFDEVEDTGQCHQYYSNLAEEPLAQVVLPV
jgi:hemerythrin-like domain-containing protein